MKTVKIELAVEDYVLCEKVAKRHGFSVAEWLTFLLGEKVGHTSFCLKG